MAIILHIAERPAWDAARAAGAYRPASLDAEGFIHCSTVHQVVETAHRFFAGRTDLVLLCIDEARCRAPVKYEPPADTGRDPAAGALFPHIYGPLPPDAVVGVVPFPADGAGRFALPEAVQALLRTPPRTDVAP